MRDVGYCKLSFCFLLLEVIALVAGPRVMAQGSPAPRLGQLRVASSLAQMQGLGLENEWPMSRRGASLSEVWQVQLGAIMTSSPIVAEVVGLGAKEIVATTFCPDSTCSGNPYGGGQVVVLTAQGVSLPGWPKIVMGNPFSGGAAVGDIDNDGDQEVVAGNWASIYAWGHDGSVLPGWPKAVGTFSSPALEDLDGDGDLEVIASSTEGELYVWHHDGTLVKGWPYVWKGGTGQGSIRSPAVADIDGDGVLEIAAATGQGPYTTEPHDFFVWEADGSVHAGFPIVTLYQADGSALGDVGSDGNVEAVFADGGFAGEDHLYLVGQSGALEAGWPAQLTEITGSAPAVGDVDGDGRRDVAIGGANIVDQACVQPRLYAVDSHGDALPGFPVDIPLVGGGLCPVLAPVLIADVDGDATPDIIVKYRDTISAYHGDGTLVGGFPYTLSDDGVSVGSMPAPALDDVDCDGELEMVVASASGRVALLETAVATSRARRPWPMYKHDAQGTSNAAFFDLFSDGFEGGDASAWSSSFP